MKITGLALALSVCLAPAWAQELKFEKLSTYLTGVFDRAAAEIVAYDKDTQRLFVVNGGAKGIDVLDASRPQSLSRASQILIPENYGSSPNSVAIRNGVIAVAVESDPKTDPGFAVFFDVQGKLLGGVRVGAQPDMITFSPDGRKVLTANEGEPSDNYSVDPEGSVSIIYVSAGFSQLKQSTVRTATFTQFNTLTLAPSIRVYSPGATAAQDFEPEYIAVSDDSKTAYVTIQEANAIAVIDLDTARVTRLMPLGFKDHSKAGAGLDASDRDNKIDIRNWPVLGLYQPDAIASFESGGKRYLVTANEGDTRGWTGFNEEARISTLNLDPTAFPNAAELKRDQNLGRLTVSKGTGDTDGDGDFDQLHVFGGRSFSIWSEDGQLVFDSGDQIEKLMAERFPRYFNSDGGGGLDTRSDNKGPEPEGLALATLRGRRYLFLGLERMSGVMVYDLTDPLKPVFVDYVHHRIFEGSPQAGSGGDHGPEGFIVIPADTDSESDPMLAVANEVSGSTTLYRISFSTPLLEAKVTPVSATSFNNEVFLDASGSQGNPISYSWRSVGRPAAIISRDPSGRSISVQFAGYGEYEIELTVTNATGQTSAAVAKLFYAGR
jgi:hypothetical protein